MKLFLTMALITFSSILPAEESDLKHALYVHWYDCWGALAGEYELKGTDIQQEEKILELGEDALRTKFFEVPDDAIKELIIGKDGQIAHVLYREKFKCAGITMNDYCGSGGCSRDFVINDKIYELRGGEPILVHANGKPVILVGRSGSNCKAHPNAASCFQAFVWDEQFKQFNAFGGHERPIR